MERLGTVAPPAWTLYIESLMDKGEQKKNKRGLPFLQLDCLTTTSRPTFILTEEGHCR
jgi:hypothetical protein